MKKLGMNPAAISLLCLLFVGIASAKDKALKATLTFEQNTFVNETLIKKGTYEVNFDVNSDEISILDGKHVLASAKATIETRGKKSEQTEMILHTTDKGMVLEGVVFHGDARNIMISTPNNSAAGTE